MKSARVWPRICRSRPASSSPVENHGATKPSSSVGGAFCLGRPEPWAGSEGLCGANARPWDRGVVEERTHGPRERSGLLVVEIVSAAVELVENDPFDRLHEGSTLRDGNDRVTISPTQGDGRELGDLVSMLVERTPLAAPVDHITHGAREGARRPR